MTWTYRDLLDTIDDYLGGSQAAIRENQKKRAVRNALNRFSEAHDWPQLLDLVRTETSASYSTGTISSSDGLTITLSGGTWPSWAAGALLLVDSDTERWCLVKYRNSDTEIVLDSNYQYASSIAASTSYELFRAAYPLPDDTHTVNQVIGENYYPYHRVTFAKWHDYLRSSASLGNSYIYAVGPNPDPLNASGRALWLWPVPNTNKTIEYVCHRWLHIPTLNYDGTSFGTLTVTTSGTTATISSGTMPTTVPRGSILRVSANASDLPVEGDTEGVVVSRDSGTVLTLESALAGGDVASVRFILSEPIGSDNRPIDEHVVREAIEFGCFYQLDQIRGVKTALSRAAYEDSLVQAMEAANAGDEVGMVGDNQNFTRPIRYWPAGTSIPW